MQEKEHLISVLESAMKALKTNNSVELQALSDQTVHSASIYQDTDSISIAVIIYSLSKIVARRESMKIKHWISLVNKISSSLSLAIDSLEKEKYSSFGNHLKKIIGILSSFSSLKPYIKDVIRKASINKASKLYEHGISLSQTAKLLGITRWELSEYIGQKSIHDNPYNTTISPKKRAEIAMEFFS